MSDNDDNVIKFGSHVGGNKTPDAKEEFPAYPYVIVDIDDNEYFYDGYLIFTTHHVCIMEDGGEKGPVTGFMMPMHRVKLVSLVDEEIDEPAH